MKRFGILVLATAPALSIGCAYQRVSKEQLRGMAASDPLNHVAYVGSDDHYHYFDRTYGLSTQRYKVATSELMVHRTFPRHKGRPYLYPHEDRPPSPSEPTTRAATPQ